MDGEKQGLLQQQEELNKTEQQLEILLERLGSELGVEVGETEALLDPTKDAEASSEDVDNLLSNEENIFKLLKSLDNAGKIMDLIDVRGTHHKPDFDPDC